MFLLLTALVSVIVSCGGGNKTITPPPGPGPTTSDISGRVTDSNGTPVPNLSILLDGQKIDVNTDASGNYVIDNNLFTQGSKDYLLSLGLGGIIFAEDVVNPTRTKSADFGFGDPGDSETGVLKGTVYDESTNETIDGALVIAFSYSGGLYFDESEQGAFEMELPSGYWLLLVWQEDYNPGVSTVEVQGGGESVQDVYLTPLGVITPPAGLIVSGTITDKDSGAPIAGALVTMSVDTGYLGVPTDDVKTSPDEPVEGGSGDTGTGVVYPDEPQRTEAQSDDSLGCMPYLPSYQETVTDASGHYEFTDGVVGYSAYFTVNAEDYLPGNEWTELPQSGDTFVKDMALEPLVMTSVTGKCVDENGDPVPNAWVELIFQGGNGGGWAMPMLDSTFMGGMVDTANAAAEDYSTREGGAPMMAGDAAPGNAGSQGGNNDFDNPMFMQYLNEQRNNRGASQEMPPDYFSGYYSVQADENGEFAIESLAAGPYYVFADAYRHISYNANLDVAPDGSTQVEILLENTPVGSVEGVVTNEDGDPIQDVLVNCVQPNRDPFAFTDADGHFRIDNIPATTGEWDTWVVGAYAVGYASKGVEVSIIEDDVLNIDFELEHYTPPTVDKVYFTGKVIDGTTGEPVAGASLYVVSRDNQYWEDAVTDSDGVFTMNLVSTEYAIDVDAESQGYQNLYTWFWVDPGYPQMEFYLWPTDSNGVGGWGGIEVGGTPPPNPDDGSTNAGGGSVPGDPGQSAGGDTGSERPLPL